MDGLLGVAGMIITSDYIWIIPSFPAFSTSNIFNYWLFHCSQDLFYPIHQWLEIPVIPSPNVTRTFFHVQPMWYTLTSLARASDGDVKEAKLKLVGGAVTANVLWNFVEVVPGTQKMRSHGPGN